MVWLVIVYGRWLSKLRKESGKGFRCLCGWLG